MKKKAGRPPRDLTGQRFGKLIVLEMLEETTKWGSARWQCLCDCGQKKDVSRAYLTSGNTTSCGCLRANDVIGQRFGSLVVIERDEKKGKSKNVRWLCQCDCGNTTTVSSNNLANNHVRSCGCEHYHIDNLSGQRFGRLTVMRLTSQKTKLEKLKWSCLCDCGRECNITRAHLLMGHTQSCGCRRLIDYDGYRFRSRWEIFWYMSAKARGVDVHYEKHTLEIIIDGITRKYTPDFWVPAWGSFVEIKGRRYERSMRKFDQATSNGNRIQLVSQKELEEWCGQNIGVMQRAFSSGGLDVVNDLIRKSTG